ncbi:MAG: hypothetical protein ABSB35_13455 [Bryobacteraceae bacterium]|jgi:hypothetical protein
MRVVSVFLLLAGFGLADTIALRDGRVVNGSYLGGDARTVRIAVGDHVDTYRVEEISTITFGGDVASAPAPAPAPYQRMPERDDVAPPPPQGVTLSAGTALTIRMIDSVDSQRDEVGKTFRASLDEPVMDANGNTLIPRGADAIVKLIDDKESGKLAGRTVLTLSLVSVQASGRMADVNSQNVTEQSASRTARSGKVIGGAAAAGAIIGALAGGGKGAAIGAGAGGAAGGVAEIATKGQRVRIPSETRLKFTLDQPVML